MRFAIATLFFGSLGAWVYTTNREHLNIASGIALGWFALLTVLSAAIAVLAGIAHHKDRYQGPDNEPPLKTKHPPTL